MSSAKEVADMILECCKANEDDEGEFQRFFLELSWEKSFFSIICTNAANE
jgi:hypothetical protein